MINNMFFMARMLLFFYFLSCNSNHNKINYDIYLKYSEEINPVFFKRFALKIKKNTIYKYFSDYYFDESDTIGYPIHQYLFLIKELSENQYDSIITLLNNFDLNNNKQKYTGNMSGSVYEISLMVNYNNKRAYMYIYDDSIPKKLSPLINYMMQIDRSATYDTIFNVIGGNTENFHDI